MFSNQILSVIEALRSGWKSAPFLISESQVCEIYQYIFGKEVMEISELEEVGNMDFLYYDCGDRSHKGAEHYRVKILKEHVEKIYQKPAGNILVVLFRNIEALRASGEQKSENSLLHIFEDVPSQVFILVTSSTPQKIIPTLQSRMIMLAQGITKWGLNPHEQAVKEYVAGNPEPLFSMTLAPSKESKFTRDDALWVIQGLQDAIEYGTLSPRHARRISDTRVLLETTNTIAKYLIDQLLISLSCD